MVRWRDEVSERRQTEGRGRSVAAASAGVLVFFLASALLNGSALHRNARGMPFGPARTASLRLTAPLDWASRATGAGRLRDWIENRWNKETP